MAATGLRRDVNADALRHPARRGSMPLWWHLLVALLVVALVQALAVKAYAVPSASMEQTLAVGDRVLVNRLAYGMGSPARGDVVVFTADEAWQAGGPADRGVLGNALAWISGLVGIGPGVEHTLVKRVIGLPGEKVACCDASGRVTVDGEPLDEPYVFEDYDFAAGSLDCESTVRSPRCFGPILVPEERYLVLGDHRSSSGDSVIGCRGSPSGSECARFVDRRDVVGRVLLVVYPFSRWGGV